MSRLVDRGTVVLAICSRLRSVVPEFALVRPYNGELDRYSKKTQVQQEMFVAEVNLSTPFALVISKERSPLGGLGNSLKLKHDISVYIGASRSFDFGSQDLPPVFDLMKKAMEALDGVVLVAGAGPLTVESDGQYLTTTDLFTIYDQRYYQFEISR